jgi:peroxiredoxin
MKKNIPTHVNDLDWVARFLRFAAIYHLLLGLELIIDPGAIFQIAQLDAPQYLWLVRGLGANVLMFALGYAVAMRNPYRYWVAGLMGLILKLGITVAISIYVGLGELPLGTLIFVVINDVAWVIPLGRYLWSVFRQYESDFFQIDQTRSQVDEALLGQYQDQRGQSLLDITQHQPTLVVFLRHFGCTFCRETLAQLSADRAEIEAQGTRLLLVHQSEPEAAERFMSKYGLQDVSRISDPERQLYEAFALKQGTRNQVFGWKSWVKGFYAAIIQRHGIGLLQGDGYQMPGGFLLKGNTILQAYRHESAADRVDYCALATVSDQALAPTS